MSLSATAADGWKRMLGSQSTVGHVKVISGYGTVGFVSGTRGTDTLVETSLTCIVTDFTSDEIDGTLVQANDRLVTADASVVIDAEKVLKIGGTTYNIVKVRKVDFAGVVVGYKIQARL